MTSSEVVTPTVRRTLRRALFWIVLAALLLAFAAVYGLTTRSTTEADRFSADEAAPAGSRALVQVLGDAGIDVVAAETLDDALAAIDDPATTTLVAADPRTVLTAEQWRELDGAAASLVLVEPPAPAVGSLAPAIAPGVPSLGGVRDEAGCSLPAALRAGSITADGLGLDASGATAADLGAAGVQLCFPGGEGEGGAALVSLDQPAGGTLHLLGAGGVVQNGLIGREGNAALALGLTGEHPRLVWYVASTADIAGGTTALSELYPGWVNPVAWLALTVGLAAAVWRGRRLGPVVIENLPVVVRTTETMEGRARLYAREGSRLRALDALRVGTLRRLAEGLALGSAAGLDDIVTAVSGITGRDRAGLRALLVDREPRDDGELVALSDELLELERLVQRRVALADDGPGERPADRPDPTTR
ncbi:DUF4350 domain-containing protein [Yonghaparkia sp. Root332]|uniref:DUF4350 domain-containing protein n=1 Tax=Yonghaparkia sp. Root332 TaxID=1736516 RepID=UPI0006FE1A8F|nr:DUF4350 domain-containing protein [Yonghaparkia sp. Root332]KQV24453.1 hypothetical protein ASC54_07830 [Yonghaparkia sp. Root332]